jgi:hypothetical protein
MDVSLRRVQVGSATDSLLASYTTTTDSGGRFRFFDIPDNRYLLRIEDSHRDEAAARRVSKKGDSVELAQPVVMRREISLQGRVISTLTGPVQVRVSIPGTGRSVMADSTGTYTLDSVPPGSYDCYYIWNEQANILPVTITGQRDTVMLRDVLLQPDSSTDVQPYSFFPQTLRNSYAITPTVYPEALDRHLYGDADLTGVVYERVNDTGYAAFTPVPYGVLFLTRFDGEGNLIEPDRKAVRLMARQGMSVVTVADSRLDTAGLADLYDLVFISFHSLSKNLGKTLRRTSVPVIVCEPNLFGSMGIAPSQSSRYIFSDSLAQGARVEVVAPDHPLAAGYQGGIDVVTGTGRVAESYPTSTSTVVISYPDQPQRAWLFYLSEGDSLADGSNAPALRVGICGGPLYWQKMSAAGEDIFMALLGWVKGRRASG